MEGALGHGGARAAWTHPVNSLIYLGSPLQQSTQGRSEKQFSHALRLSVQAKHSEQHRTDSTGSSDTNDTSCVK